MSNSSQSRTEIHKSLRRIVQTILGTPTFWPSTELAGQLKQDIETLLGRIDSMESQVAHDYAYALSKLVRHMPDEISKVYHGNLAELVASAARPHFIRT